MGLWAGVLWGADNPPPSVAVRPNILVVLSYHVGMEWEEEVLAGLHETLGGRAELVLVQLDVKRFPQPGREEAMEVNLLSKFGMSHPAAVIAIDDFAYDFVLRRRAQLPVRVPLVFGGVNFLAREPPAGVGGVVEAVDLGGTLALARALFPRARRLVVVNDATETGRSNDAALAHALGAGEAFPWVLRLGQGTFAETEAMLAGLDPVKDVVLLLSWNLDGAGATRTYDEAVAAARGASPAPLFGPWSFYFGRGIVGGSLLDGRVHGREVGEIAALAVTGGPDQHLPLVGRCRTELMVDERELRRFSVPLSAVPSRARVRYAERSFWRQYWRELSLVGLVIGLQGLTIGHLLWVRRRERRSERMLRASEADLRQTLDSIGDAVVVADADSRIVRMNPVAERLTGRAVGDALGRGLAEVLHLREPDTGASLDDLLGAGTVAASRPQPVTGRAALTAADGSPRILEYSAAPVLDAGGTLRGSVLALRDVTAQQRTEAQLRQSQKTEALGRLVGGVAHDFNNLLLVIRGSVELARQPGTTGEETTEYLHDIEQAAQRAAELTRQLLAFGRQQKLQVRPVDLAALLAGMLKMVRRVLSETITVEMQGPAEGCWANVDAGQIEQVVMNLCVNARDAMPEGGRITLELGQAQLDGAGVDVAGAARPGRYQVITVADNGVGMPPEVQRRVFEPFFSTKPLGRGTGLGLSVVQGIVHQHEGMIEVRSEVGHGTMFRIYLPAAEAPARAGSAPKAPPPAAAPPDEGAGRVLLLAEDDPGVRRIAGGLLRSQGYEVLEAENGEEACRLAADHAGPIAAAVLDVVMPRMSGPEAARRLQQARPGLPILLCSGYTGMAHKEAAFAPDWQWLAKPYAVADLLECVRRMLAAANAL